MANTAQNLEIVKPGQEPAQSQSVWDRIAASREFKDLIAIKKTFIVPAFIFFLVYYFALPVLVGYAPKFMAMKVIGQVNLAYLFALSQFFVAWIIAALYVKAANNFDRLAKDILDKTGKGDKRVMNISLIMFLVFIAVTLAITYWASRRSAGSSAYFAASRQITGWQNGIAVAGDYMSAASFLGIAGIIAFQGYEDRKSTRLNSSHRCSSYAVFCLKTKK